MDDLIFTSLHGEKRNRVLKSHYKYLKLFITHGTKEEFQNLIKYFIKEGKSKSYCRSVIETIHSYLMRTRKDYKMPIHKSYVNKIYCRAKKIEMLLKTNADFESLNFIELYDSDGTMHKIKNSGHSETVKVVNMGVTKHIESDKAEYILHTVMQHLNTYVKSNCGECKYGLFEDLCLLILILSNTGARKSEIFGMCLYPHIQDLMIKHETSIKTKQGINKICVGPVIAQTIADVIERRNKDDFSKDLQQNVVKLDRLIVYPYKQLRLAFITFYKSLFNAEKPKGLLFHIWRTYYTSIAYPLNAQLTQQTLNHSNSKMTQKYLQNQMLNDKSLCKDLLNRIECHNLKNT